MTTLSDIKQNDTPQQNEMCECKICHLLFESTQIDQHQKQCEDVFNQCKEEYDRRGLGMTDQDIIDLLVGNVPAHAIQLERCEICGKKILPKLMNQHKEQCEIKHQNKIQNDQSNTPQEIIPKSDYKDNHCQLIEKIRQDKREAKFLI